MIEERLRKLQRSIEDLRFELGEVKRELTDAQSQLCFQGNLIVSMGKRLLKLSKRHGPSERGLKRAQKRYRTCNLSP